MFNGCTSYEHWDIDYLGSQVSEYGTLKWFENAILLLGWVVSRLGSR